MDPITDAFSTTAFPVGIPIQLKNWLYDLESYRTSLYSPIISGIKKLPDSGNPIVESTVTVEFSDPTETTLVLLFILKSFIIESELNDILKNFLLPKNMGSTFEIDPDAVGLSTEFSKIVLKINLVGSPLKLSTIISSVTFQLAPEDIIVLSNGFKISTFFPNRTEKRIFKDVSVPFEE